jgi:hypothetical protein
MIYIINTTDLQKKECLEDFLKDNGIEYYNETQPCRIKKLNINISSDMDFENLDIADIGLLKVKLEGKADMQFMVKLAALIEQTTGQEIK